MLKSRVIPTLLYKDFGLVKGVGFDSWRRVGPAMQSIKIYNMRDVDELVFLDITATRNGREPEYSLIENLAKECFSPFSVGGGVSKIEHVRNLLMAGADKVIINTAAVRSPGFVSEVASRFGSQCVIVSVDARKMQNTSYEVVTDSGTYPTGIDVINVLSEVERQGAGEILITSIDNDGTMKGYDLQLVELAVATVSVPVIASGGAGNFEHMGEALKVGASAVAAASIFHFTEQTPNEAKRYLRQRGFQVRKLWDEDQVTPGKGCG